MLIKKGPLWEGGGSREAGEGGESLRFSCR